MEKWRIIPSMPTYSISSLGRVKSIKRKIPFNSKKGNRFWRIKEEKIVSTQIQNGGYELVHLHYKNKRKARTVHSLIAEAFLGRRVTGMDVCHNNGVRLDNRLANIRYDSRSNNFNDMHSHGTYYLRISNAKLSRSQIIKIRKLAKSNSATSISRLFGVVPDTISRIIRGETWGHIK